jgi:BolA family transcriptional regulator, general stress-responsive regulator
MSESRSLNIREALRAAFASDEIEVIDESAAHAGHAGAREGGHYRVRIVSARFAGHSTLERHRLVYDALGGLKGRGIHALSIRALAPGEPD